MDTVSRIKELGKLTMRLTDFDCISVLVKTAYFLIKSTSVGVQKRCSIPHTSRQLVQESTTKQDNCLAAMPTGVFS